VPRSRTAHPSESVDDLLSVDRDALRPLAERIRPCNFDEMVGQRRLLAPGSALRQSIEAGHVHSMVLWGPPGCGKTTLALLLAKYADAHFRAISAVLSGLPEVRQVLAEAGHRFAEGRRTVLFVDEVHRFNKAQQDAFLPHIERGTILFVGATTENPSFELNSALLSRCRVHVMDAVSADDILIALRHALEDAERGLGGRGLQVDEEHLRLIAVAADGDVRRALTLLEIAAELVGAGRSRLRSSNRYSPTAPAASTRAASSSTTRSPHCTSRCAVPIRMLRCTGWRGCSTEVAIRSISRGD
jgi:putative ATPase